jgi:hypothetical protein
MESNIKILPAIITALFRDGYFHCLKDKSGGAYYIDILDDLVKNDIELLELSSQKIDKRGINKYIRKISDIAGPYLRNAKENLKMLEKNKWLKINTMNIEVMKFGFTEKERFEGVIIPPHRTIGSVIKMKIEWVNWEKFIEYISSEGEKLGWIDLENTFSVRKQNVFILVLLSKLSTYLDKSKNIILPIKYIDKDDNDLFQRVRFLKTIKRLEKTNYIIINGVKAFRAKEKEIEYIGLKVNISLTKKFYDLIKTSKGIKKTNSSLKFDLNKSILIINNKPVKIQKFSNQYYLLEIIFENKEARMKDWQFSEISEDSNSTLGGFTDKKIYNIANAIKHKIKGEAHINDLFITTTHSIKINNKYLKKS